MLQHTAETQNVFHILPCPLVSLLLGLSMHPARTSECLAFPSPFLTPLLAPQPHQTIFLNSPVRFSCHDAFGVSIVLCWCPQQLHRTSAFYFWGLSSHSQVPAVGLPSPITDKSCIESFRFLSPGYRSLHQIISLPTS